MLKTTTRGGPAPNDGSYRSCVRNALAVSVVSAVAAALAVFSTSRSLGHEVRDARVSKSMALIERWNGPEISPYIVQAHKKLREFQGSILAAEESEESYMVLCCSSLSSNRRLGGLSLRDPFALSPSPPGPVTVAAAPREMAHP